MAGDGAIRDRPLDLARNGSDRGLHDTLALKPADDSQRTAQPEMLKALYTAMDARRQRIVISQSAVGTVKWAGICYRDSAPWSLSPWFTATTGLPALWH